MLKRVLQEMFTGNVHSRADLARRLGVSEGLLAQMMEDLGRKGYLKPISSALECNSGCCGSFRSCTACACGESIVRQGWALTEKGLKAAKPDRQ